MLPLYSRQSEKATDSEQPKMQKPEELTKEDHRQLIELVRNYKQTWFLRRRMVVKRVLKGQSATLQAEEVHAMHLDAVAGGLGTREHT